MPNSLLSLSRASGFVPSVYMLSAVISLQDPTCPPSHHHQHRHSSVGRLLGAQSHLRGWRWTRSLLKTLKSPASCSFYLLMTPRHNGLKQKPFYYAHDFVGQEFRQSTVGVAYLYSVMLGASGVVLIVRGGWDPCARAICLGLPFCL